MVLSAAADMALGKAAPSVRLGYETLFAAVAGYVTARIALRRPFTHVLVMAAIVLAGRAFIATLTWDVVPLWFNLGVLALIIPAALLGAKLSELRRTA